MRKTQIFIVAAMVAATPYVPTYAQAPTGRVTHQYPEVGSSAARNRQMTLPSAQTQIMTPPSELPQNSYTQPGRPDPSPGQPSLGIQGAPVRPPPPSDVPSNAP